MGHRRRQRSQEVDARIGASTRAARRAIGMSQGDLADAIDMDATQMSRFERGHHIVSVAMAMAIGDALGISWRDLIDGDWQRPDRAEDV